MPLWESILIGVFGTIAAIFCFVVSPKTLDEMLTKLWRGWKSR